MADYRSPATTTRLITFFNLAPLQAPIFTCFITHKLDRQIPMQKRLEVPGGHIYGVLLAD